MKIIAFYLPQFHEIAENNEWWGEGFTEWTNTTRAQKLFKEHNQPREPLNDYYYNLLKPETKQWQTDLANEYGIYGFCYYHYWFNGKKLLEKPLEQVLEMPDLDQKFCMSWANEPWSRTWYAGREKEVLVPQEYGNEAEWEEHFRYLLPFFRDQRYIKVDEKPMFLIYKPESIPCFDKMMIQWQKLAHEAGFPGLHIVKMLNCYENNPVNSEQIAYNVEFEPGYTIKDNLPFLTNIIRKTKRLITKTSKGKIPLIDQLNYDTIWKQILRRKHEQPTYLGAFIDWDNTARRGKNALIMEGFTPDKFANYMKQQVKRSKEANNEFLFINAWNEWAEGTYLEPDKKHGYAFLEAIKAALADHE